MTRDCEKTRSSLFSYASGELSGDESRAVEAHVGECGPCARRLEACVSLREGFSLLREREEPRGMWKGYWGEIEERVREQRPLWHVWRPVAATAAAAALLLLLAVPLWQWRRGVSKAPVERGEESAGEYCVVRRAQAGDPSSDLLIYQVDEARLTIIWILESPGEERRSRLEGEATARAQDRLTGIITKGGVA